MQNNQLLKGIFFALAAAAANATIGIFSKVVMAAGLSAANVALAKTVLGFLILSLILTVVKKEAAPSKMYQAALCAFLGIFVLFHFETAAYKSFSAAGVVVMLMASASISSIVLGRLLLKDPITAQSLGGAALAIAGIIVIFGGDLDIASGLRGALLAIAAGCGYGAFSVLMKKMNMAGGLGLTRKLLFFGSIYLCFPAGATAFPPGALSMTVVGAVLALAIVPTIVGFFCTTKALELLKPSQVQAIELSEPLFSAVLAFIFLREHPSNSIFLGGILIILGICVSNSIFSSIKNVLFVDTKNAESGKS